MNDQDPAKARFFVIAAIRLAAVLFIMLGIAIVSDIVDLPRVVGWVVLGLGLIEFFVIPPFLARMWSTPRE